MACVDYVSGSSYDAAMLQADICTYESYRNTLNAIAGTYEGMINLSVDHFNAAADFNQRAKALAIANEIAASIGLSGKATQSLNEAMLKVDEATAYVGNDTTHGFVRYGISPRIIMKDVYDAQGNFMYSVPIITGHYIAPLLAEEKTYSQAIAYINQVASRIENYSSWSVGINIGSGGSFTISTGTINTLLNLSLEAAYDVGLIDQDTYEKITMSPLWQMGLTAVASMGVSYGMSQLGYTKTPFGSYMDNATYAEMFTPEVMNVFDTISAITSVYDAYSTYKEYKDLKDQKESVESSSQRELRDYADTGIYASGDYYKFFAGQKLFNAAMPGHENYVPASAQIPSWGIVKDNLHTEDSFTSMIMNQNRNATMAGGSGYLNHITEGVIKNRF